MADSLPDPTLPDGQIVPNTLGLVLVADPAQTYGKALAAALYEDLAGDGYHTIDAPEVAMRLGDDGPVILRSFHYLDLPDRTLAVEVHDHSAGTTTYVLLRENTLTNTWDQASRVAILPLDPSDWGPSDRANERLYGNVLIFAGLANWHGWFDLGPTEAPGAE